MIKLEISAFENQPARVFPISLARTTIGRNPQNDIVVNSGIMSGAHAEIVRTDDGVLRIEDLGSINGTFVNDEQITGSPIESGDKLRFGNIEGLLTESDEAERAVFGNLAISQAKQAMEKLHQGLPNGFGQTAEVETGAVSEAAAAEPPPQDTVAPGSPPQSLLNEPATELPSSDRENELDADLARRDSEIEMLRARISELEKSESDLVLANHALTESVDSHLTNTEETELRQRLARAENALSQKAEVIAELSEQFQENQAALADQQRDAAELKESFEAIKQQADQSSAEKVDLATAETAALRDELDALKEIHGEVADTQSQLSAILQTIESHEPERARLEQEMVEFLAQAEVERVAAIEENGEVTRALEESRKQLEIQNLAVNEVEKQEVARAEKSLAEFRELEQKRKTEADALARIEEQKAAAEQQFDEVTLSTGAMETERDRIEFQIAKGEKALNRIQRKIGRRKKLLVRLKKVGRREREVARKIKEGKRFVDAAESHNSGGNLPAQVQPWDIDRARADRDKAIKEARLIQQEVELVKAALKDRQQEFERLDAPVRKKENMDTATSEVTGDHEENVREIEPASRLAADLRAVRRGLAR